MRATETYATDDQSVPIQEAKQPDTRHNDIMVSTEIANMHAKTPFFTYRQDAKMVILANWSHKGGVGKTTTAALLAEVFANHIVSQSGKRVLIVDVDPQCSLSERYLKMPHTQEEYDSYQYHEPPPNWSPVLFMDGTATDHNCSNDKEAMLCAKTFSSLLEDGALPIAYRTANPHIDIIPGSGSGLMKVARVINDERRQYRDRARAFLNSKPVRDRYGLVIFDCPPHTGGSTGLALDCCTHCYIPFVPDGVSQDSLPAAIARITQAAESRPRDIPLSLLALIPVAYARTRQHEAMLAQVANGPYGNMLMRGRQQATSAGSPKTPINNRRKSFKRKQAAHWMDRFKFTISPPTAMPPEAPETRDETDEYPLVHSVLGFRRSTWYSVIPVSRAGVHVSGAPPEAIRREALSVTGNLALRMHLIETNREAIP